MLQNAEFPLTITSHAIGEPATRIDNRELNIQIFGLLLDNDKSIIDLKKTFQPDNDIIEYTQFQESGFFAELTTGWHGIERNKGKYYRWTNSNPVIDIRASNDHYSLGGYLTLDIEPGPYHQELPIKLTVFDNDSNIVVQEYIISKQKVTIPLSGVTPPLKFSAPPIVIPSKSKDARPLNLKISNINWVSS
jgi:hypothetical protein